MANPVVIAVDDEEALLTMYDSALSDRFDVKTFGKPKAALFEIVSGCQVDVIITDLMMPEMSGVEFMEAIRQKAVNIPVIVATGYADKKMAIKTIQLGAFSLLEKPLNFNELFNVVQRAAIYSQLAQQNDLYFNVCNEMIQAMQANTSTEEMKSQFKARLEELRLKTKTLKKMQEVLAMLEND